MKAALVYAVMTSSLTNTAPRRAGHLWYCLRTDRDRVMDGPEIIKQTDIIRVGESSRRVLARLM